MNSLINISLLLVPVFFAAQFTLLVISWLIKYKSLHKWRLVFNIKNIEDLGFSSIYLSTLYCLTVMLYTMADMDVHQQSISTQSSWLGFLPHKDILMSMTLCTMDGIERLSQCKGFDFSLILIIAAYSYYKLTLKPLKAVFNRTINIQ